MAAAWLSWLERRVSDRKVFGSMLVLGITSLCPWQRHNADFLTGSLCGVERLHRDLFHNGIHTGENIKNKWTWYCRYLGLGNNCSIA